jgi:hypothetical protein
MKGPLHFSSLVSPPPEWRQFFAVTRHFALQCFGHFLFVLRLTKLYLFFGLLIVNIFLKVERLHVGVEILRGFWNVKFLETQQSEILCQ